MTLRLLLSLLLTASVAFAQKGDKSGEKQESRVPPEKIPANPPLAPADALKKFRLPPGFRIELVAAEPMVQTPITMQWDADGRLWVVEYRSYMPNAGTYRENTSDGDPKKDPENQPINRISVLEDSDGDGKMDKKTVFLDQLVMPRAICLAYGGVLVCEPPALWWYPIEAGLKPGTRVLVDKDYARAGDPSLGDRKNPEHTANSPTWFLHNWIVSANHTFRYRRVEDEWKRQPTTFRGQWGLSMDDWGRPYYNSNSDQLRTDLVPSEYFFRNPFHRSTSGLNQQPLKDQTTWPARVNPGVNRGYQAGTLKPDGTLAKYTATCGPGIYRGDSFPAEFLGNAFIPEPSGNFVRRLVLTESAGEITGANPYPEDEFLTSTDELFRPVNAYTGPDGCLYVVDMYHGSLQHRNFLTTYLRGQYESRGLDKVTQHGRIYRIVHEGKRPGPRPTLGSATPVQLVATLSHPNGWWRDTAQRLLVEKPSASVIAPLKQLATSSPSPRSRLHALWTLDGLGYLDAATVIGVLDKDTNPRIRAAAIRVSESLLKGEDKGVLLPKLAALATSKDLEVQAQLAFTLGEVNDPAATAAMAVLAHRAGSSPLVRDALISGLALREVETLEKLFADSAWKQKVNGGDSFIGALAKSIFQQARADRVNRLLEQITRKETPPWQTLAVLASLGTSAPTVKGQPPLPVKLVRLPAAPPALGQLERSTDKVIQTAAKKLDSLLIWPGKPGVPPLPPVRALTSAEQARFTAGKSAYESTCAACHQLHGYGQDGMAPPLVDAEWVAGPQERLVRIVLHGIGGPINVLGRRWDMDMPGHGALDDEAIANILTFIRREWEHTYDPVTPEFVKQVRAATAGRESAWTNDELMTFK